MLQSFTALDFETATGKRSSICQVGLIRVVNGEIKHKVDLLVQPPGNEYSWYNINIHNITPQMTRRSPTFDKVWPIIEPFITGQDIVAHSIGFDASCIKKALEYYEIEIPQFRRRCTYKIFGHSLDVCCGIHGIPLNHHNALSDALACAELFKIHLKSEKEGVQL